MHIVIFGASGKIGSAIVGEALDRGHDVVAAVRDPARVDRDHANLEVVRARVDDRASVEATVAGADAVVDAVGGLGHENTRISIECMEPLVDGMNASGVRRLLIVGTAGTLEVEPGKRRMDQPDFPDILKAEAQAQLEIQEFLGGLPDDGFEWTYFSPPALIEAGTRTGRVELGGDMLPRNDAGKSYISDEDYAMATIDELERPRHVRRRFTAVSA